MIEQPDRSTSYPAPIVAGDAIARYTIGAVYWRELRAVARLQQAAFRTGLAYGIVALSVLRGLPGVIFLVARDIATHDVIGTVIADRHRGDLRIMNLATDPDHRRKGIARALIRAASAAGPGGNLILMVEERNAGARKLYEAEGFSQVGFARDMYGQHRHGLWMKQIRGGDGSAPLASNRNVYV